MANKSIKITIASALNASGFTAARRVMSNFVSGVASFAKSVGSNLMNIKAGFDMVSGAASKLFGFLKGAVNEAFKIEGAEAGFKTLLGNIDAAREHLADLRSFAAATPLTLGDLAGASKLLLSFGADVNEIMPSLKMLGDISLGNAEKFKGLSLVFAQVKAAGRLMGQDLLQMINQGFNPLAIISQETGRSIADLKKDMENGAISFGMVEAAMRKATGEGGRFHDAMKNASKTGNGLVSTMQDNWSATLANFGSAFTDAAKNGVEKLTEAMQRLNEDGSIVQWANTTFAALEKIVGVAEKATRAVGRFFGLGEMNTQNSFMARIGGIGAGLANADEFGGGMAGFQRANLAYVATHSNDKDSADRAAKELNRQMRDAGLWTQDTDIRDLVKQADAEDREMAKRESEQRKAEAEKRKAEREKASQAKPTTIQEEMAKAQAETTAKFEKEKQKAIDETMAKYKESVESGGESPFAPKPDMSGVKKALEELSAARTDEELKAAKAAVETAMKRQKAEEDAFRRVQKLAREASDNAAEFVAAAIKDQEDMEKEAAKEEADKKMQEMKKLHDARMKQIDDELEKAKKSIDELKAKGAENPMQMAGGGFWGQGNMDQAGDLRLERQKKIDENRAKKAEDALKKRMEKAGATLEDPSKLGRLSNLEKAALERMRLKKAEDDAKKLQKERDDREKQIAADLDAIRKKLQDVGL